VAPGVRSERPGMDGVYRSEGELLLDVGMGGRGFSPSGPEYGGAILMNDANARMSRSMPFSCLVIDRSPRCLIGDTGCSRLLLIPRVATSNARRYSIPT
jgi:hypothetical protein